MIKKIYHVVCFDQFNRSEAETQWHTSEKYCIDYKEKSPWKHCLHIESSELIDDKEEYEKAQ